MAGCFWSLRVRPTFWEIFPWSPLWRISNNGRFWFLCEIGHCYKLPELFWAIFRWSPLWRISKNGRFWCLCRAPHNLVRWLHFKRILIIEDGICGIVFLEPASSAYFLSDFSLVPPLKNFQKWPILVSLQNWSLFGIAGTFRAAVWRTLLSDDCTLSAY